MVTVAPTGNTCSTCCERRGHSCTSSPDAVAQAVRERVAQPSAGDHVARDGVELAPVTPARAAPMASALRLTDGVVGSRAPSSRARRRRRSASGRSSSHPVPRPCRSRLGRRVWIVRLGRAGVRERPSRAGRDDGLERHGRGAGASGAGTTISAAMARSDHAGWTSGQDGAEHVTRQRLRARDGLDLGLRLGGDGLRPEAPRRARTPRRGRASASDSSAETVRRSAWTDDALGAH